MMRILIIILSLLLSETSFARQGIDNDTSFCLTGQLSRERMGGVYYAYHAPHSIPWYTPAPKGYIPFYISHYGRHGSRWLTSDERHEWVNRHFAAVDNLTPLGISVRNRLEKIWINAKGNGGKLTPLGAFQHRRIAERMFQNFPEIFTRDVVVSARSSTAGRCISSMMAFTGELEHLNPKLKVICKSNKEFMAYLAYTSPEEKALEAHTNPVPVVSIKRLMKALFKNPDKVTDQYKLMSELYAIDADMQDVGLKINFDDVFTEKEYLSMYDSNNQRMRICNGNVVQNKGFAARCAIPLWQNIVQSADSAIDAGKPSASLRFGHDTSLYRLFSFLQMSLSGGMDNIIPMAANLQMVFYKPDTCQNGHKKISSKDVLVKFMHNEVEATVPVRTTMWPYYRWADVKAYYVKRIERLGHLRQLNAVNTMVGTAMANTRSVGLFGKGSEEHGQTLPAVLAPNGQDFWTPQTQDTEQKCIAPYYYKDSLFQGIRDSHWIVGGCTQDYGSFTVDAISGSLRTQPEQRATRFYHQDEISHPYYYSVKLPDEHLRIGLTGSSHCAFFRITSSHDSLVHIIINPNSDAGEGYVRIETKNHLVYGYNPVHRIYQGWGEKAGFCGHFLLHYDQSPIAVGTFCRNVVNRGDTVISGKPRIGVYLTFRISAGIPLILKAASSFTGYNGAKKNLMKEASGIDFEKAAARLSDLWIDRFHTIDVFSTDTALVNQFYGSLYRASFLPRELSDVDGAYPKFADGKTIMKSSRRYYTDYSMWDTYRAVHPLCNIIAPKLSADMMQSLVNMYCQGGWLPIFPCWNSYTSEMIGDHCSAALADAYIKGIRDFDINKAYEGMRRNAFESPSFTDYKEGKGRRALIPYLRYGYIPLEDSVKEAFHQNEQVSRTLEYAFDDFAVAQVAKELGHQQDYRILMKRAHNYRNVINPATGWADGRYKNGGWLNNKDYVHRMPFITEGAVCHYTWYVPQDVYGLMRIMGGRQRFVAKLDSVFSQNWYWQGNEPCHQIAYMYAYAGEPWKTQKQVRHIMTEYLDDPGGLPGNDDAGQMSAWYIFSALGFYPVCPAAPYYVLGSPVFDKAVISLPNGKVFTICTRNQSGKNIYIQKAWLNGRPYTRNYLMHKDIIAGGELLLEMGDTPNGRWGSRPEDCPGDPGMNQTDHVYKAKDLGIIGDGKTLNTEAIQKAINSIADRGGGKLIFTPGVYLTGTIMIKSNIELHLDSGAIIKGSPLSRDYYPLCHSMPDANHKTDDSGLGLILAHDSENISLTGDGTIDGNGRAVALDVDSLYHAGLIKDSHYNKFRHRPGELVRPSLFNFTGCTGVKIQDLHLRNSAGWGLSFDLCKNMVLERLKILNRAYWNNDGIDISDCQRALIRDCRINSADDGICLKSYHVNRCNNHITIRNCEVCSSASAIKFGTASYGGFRNIEIDSIRIKDTFRSAIALECVDGGVLEDVHVSHIEARNVGNAIFIRLGDRSGSSAGIVKNIHIQDLYCEVPFGRPDIDYDLRGPEVNFFHNPFPSSITGIPSHPVENVLLKNITIVYPGRASKGMAYLPLSRLKDIPELEKSYPEFSMFGELPAWGFFVRHVKNIIFHNVKLKLKDKDFRPAYVFKDVGGCRFEQTNTRSIYREP